ncbi:MAG: hypothetical protein INQ03_17080 [Candidatus Heimdallarchaeota archaeon]|nr:hypothetical protein [Candidatus Heimdallarchaeota archaeon]
MGTSETAISFIETLLDSIDFSHLLQVVRMDDAVMLLLEHKFSIVILDADCEHVNVISFSRAIRINHPASRVIVLSKSDSIEFLISLVNFGSVNSFIQPDAEVYDIYKVILEQHARFTIINMLTELISNPPRFTPAYFMLYDPKLMDPNLKDDFSFIGCIFSYDDKVRFSYFDDSLFDGDPTLLSLYLSAIPILGERLLSEKVLIDEINFEGISILYNFDEGLQHAILLRNLNNLNIRKAENFVRQFIALISSSFDNSLRSREPIEQKEEQDILQSVTNYVQNKLGIRDHHDEDISIVSFNFEYHYSLGEYIITQIDDLSELKLELYRQNIDILMIHSEHSKLENYQSMLSMFKEISPKITLIELNDNITKELIWNTLYLNQVDYLIPDFYSIFEVKEVIDNAIYKAITIESNIKSPYPLDLQFEFEQETIVKSLIRMRDNYFIKIPRPTLRAIYIMRHQMYYYHKIWSDEGVVLEFDEQAFINFINSIEKFSNEIMHEQKMISGIRFGKDMLIIKQINDITIIIFTRDVNFTNYFLTNKYIYIAAIQLYSILSIANIPTAWTIEENQEVEQIMTELFLNFSSLNTTEF